MATAAAAASRCTHELHPAACAAALAPGPLPFAPHALTANCAFDARVESRTMMRITSQGWRTTMMSL